MTSLIVLPLVAAVQAQDFSETDKALAPAEETSTALSAEFGGALATGNTDYVTFNGAVTGSRTWGANKVGAVAGVNYGLSRVDQDGDGKLSDGERAFDRAQTAQRVFVEGRYDRFLGEASSLYVLGGAFQDPFAGYRLRVHEQVGYSRQLIKSDTTGLVVELGVDVAHEFFVEGVDPATALVPAARGLVGFNHKFNERVELSDRFEVYENVLDFRDLRILNTAALTAKLSDTFSLKLSHALIYDNVPVEGFRKMDQTTLVTLVASIF